MSAELPIAEVLEDIRSALRARHELVLEAPPGAGKTTLVPLALLGEPWLQGQKILLLEPRRLAARAAAERMAQLLGESVGETVGYRVRLESKVGPHTRIEVVTEGILTRLIQQDPALEGVGLVIFDEFHERSLDSDLGLALCLQGREIFRDEQALKIVLMSATLDGQRLAGLLNQSPLIRSEGRQFPVEIVHGSSQSLQDSSALLGRVVEQCIQALQRHSGNLLVFLPGQGEIRRVQDSLQERLCCDPQCQDIVLTPLYGDLSLKAQRQAIDPPPAGRRKVVLATDIAESSLTIEGITVVVDSGLSRESLFEPRTGMNQLHTCRLSQDASEQRAGRAGRLQAGVCYRLWSREQQQQLRRHRVPEILKGDLLPLALQLLRWGDDQLQWLDEPPGAAMAQARAVLQGLGACDEQGRITAHGQRMADLPLHPRLAHMLIVGCYHGYQSLACEVGAILSERDFLNNTPACDLQLRVAALPTQGPSRLKKQAQQFARLCRHLSPRAELEGLVSAEQALGFLLACAYPDRIALRRKGSVYQLSNGRSALFPEPDSLQQHPYLVVASVGGRQGSDRIFLAAELDSALFAGPLASLVRESTAVEWSEPQQRLVAETRRCVGALVIARQSLSTIPAAARQDILVALVKKRGLEVLPWTRELRQWQARVNLLHGLQGAPWPDLSDQQLLQTLETWLGPYLHGIQHINDFAKLDLKALLHSLLPWELQQRLNQLMPEKLSVPSGAQVSIDYQANPPVLAVKLQAMFGCETTPCVAGGKLPVMLHLLSPAQRPIQVTQDLASFWRNAYTEVKKEMRGRYPKHPWPDDPLSAPPSHRVKKPKTPAG